MPNEKGIDRLTPAQSAELERWEPRWARPGCGGLFFPRNKIVRAADRMYRAVGLQPPLEHLFCESPAAAFLAVAERKSRIDLRSRLDRCGWHTGKRIVRAGIALETDLLGQAGYDATNTITDRVYRTCTGWLSFGRCVSSELDPFMTKRERAAVTDLVRQQICEHLMLRFWSVHTESFVEPAIAALNVLVYYPTSLLRSRGSSSSYWSYLPERWESLWDPVGNTADPETRRHVQASVRRHVAESVRDVISSAPQLYGLAEYAFLRDCCGLSPAERLDAMIELYDCCGWWVPYERAIILIARPVRIGPHDGGAVVEYADGWYFSTTGSATMSLQATGTA